MTQQPDPSPLTEPTTLAQLQAWLDSEQSQPLTNAIPRHTSPSAFVA